MIMKDLDDLFGEWTSTHINKMDYQEYIYKFIESHNNKPLVLVGLDADLCLGPRYNPKLEGYDIPTKYKY